MEAKFRLQQQGKAQPVVVLYVFDSRFPGRKFLYSTGKHYSGDEKAFEKKNFPPDKPQFKAIRDHLKGLQDAVERWGDSKIGSTTLIRADLKKYLKNLGKDERREQEQQMRKSVDLFKLWETIITESKNAKTGEPITAGTKRSKQQTLNLITQYCIDRNVKLTLKNLDMEFYHSFDSYMAGKTLDSNTRGKHIKEIKAIIRAAAERDYEVNPSYQKKAFKVIKKDIDAIYLNEAELKKLFAIKMSSAKEAVRDFFLMACFVGARHSDWHQIRQANIVKGEFLKIKQKKTGDIIHVPLHPVVRMLLNKYDGNPPKVISNQKCNDALKEICKHEDLTAGMNGEQVKAWLKKAEQVTTHTARRSFATNAYLSRSMSTYSIMSCTGHRTEASFLKYLKLSGLDKAQDIKDSKFFKDNGWASLKVAS